MASTQLKVSISFRVVSNQRSAIQQTPWEANYIGIKSFVNIRSKTRGLFHCDCG